MKSDTKILLRNMWKSEAGYQFLTPQLLKLILNDSDPLGVLDRHHSDDHVCSELRYQSLLSTRVHVHY
jgi:hypothetical protein